MEDYEKKEDDRFSDDSEDNDFIATEDLIEEYTKDEIALDDETQGKDDDSGSEENMNDDSESEESMDEIEDSDDSEEYTAKEEDEEKEENDEYVAESNEDEIDGDDKIDDQDEDDSESYTDDNGNMEEDNIDKEGYSPDSIEEGNKEGYRDDTDVQDTGNDSEQDNSLDDKQQSNSINDNINDNNINNNINPNNTNTEADEGYNTVDKGSSITDDSSYANADNDYLNNTGEMIVENQNSENTKADIDKELEQLLAKQKAHIKVIGTGGAGNNTVNRIREVGIVGTEIIAVNTDAQDLLYTTADKKILLGKDLTGGLGAGSVPKIGEEAARESEHEIKNALQESDMVFITCGLGGGTGTGSAPVIAEISKKLGALTVAIVTIPFAMEGQRRYENALMGLEKLEKVVDTLIVIPNDKLLELAPDLPVQTAFKVADEILTNAVKGIAELVTKAGLVNLDFADIRAVMGNGGVAMIGVGESDTENRAIEAVEKAINNPLLDVDISGANGALINVVGGEDMTLEEARSVVETVSNKMDEDARLIWGAQLSADMQSTIRVMLIVTGVKSPQIFGHSRRRSDVEKKEIEDDLGIEFLD